MERQRELQPFDFHNSAAYHVPFDGAFERDCALVEFDGSLDCSVELPLLTDADSHSPNGA